MFIPFESSQWEKLLVLVGLLKSVVHIIVFYPNDPVQRAPLFAATALLRRCGFRFFWREPLLLESAGKVICYLKGESVPTDKISLTSIGPIPNGPCLVNCDQAMIDTQVFSGSVNSGPTVGDFLD